MVQAKFAQYEFTGVEVMELRATLKNLGNIEMDAEAYLWIARNSREVNKLAEDLAAMQKLPENDTFKTYGRKRSEIERANAVEDENGKPVFVDASRRSYQIADPAKMNLEIAALEEDMPEAIAFVREHREKVEKLMADTYTLELYPLKFSWFPTKLKPNTLGIVSMIVEFDRVPRVVSDDE